MEVLDIAPSKVVPKADPMALLEAVVRYPAPAANPEARLEEIRQTQAKDPVAQLETANARSILEQSVAATKDLSVVACERIRLPALSTSRLPSSPSPSPEPGPTPSERRAKAQARVERARDPRNDLKDPVFGPLERMLLRSGEIMESYSVKSSALGR